jgi:hypothetical protein
MIPRRTKLRELVIDSWRLGFQKLKLDLAVRLPLYLPNSPLDLFFAGCCWADLLYDGHLE